MVTIMEIPWRGCGNSRNTSVKTVHVRDEIPTRHLPKTWQKNYSLSQLSRWHNCQPITVPGTAGSDHTTSGVYVNACYFPLLILKNSKLRACFILTQLRWFLQCQNAYYDVCACVSSLRINACFKCSVYISHIYDNFKIPSKYWTVACNSRHRVSAALYMQWRNKRTCLQAVTVRKIKT